MLKYLDHQSHYSKKSSIKMSKSTHKTPQEIQRQPQGQTIKDSVSVSSYTKNYRKVQKRRMGDPYSKDNKEVQIIDAAGMTNYQASFRLQNNRGSQQANDQNFQLNNCKYDNRIEDLQRYLQERSRNTSKYSQNIQKYNLSQMREKKENKENVNQENKRVQINSEKLEIQEKQNPNPQKEENEQNQENEQNEVEVINLEHENQEENEQELLSEVDKGQFVFQQFDDQFLQNVDYYKHLQSKFLIQEKCNCFKVISGKANKCKFQLYIDMELAKKNENSSNLPQIKNQNLKDGRGMQTGRVMSSCKSNNLDSRQGEPDIFMQSQYKIDFSRQKVQEKCMPKETLPIKNNYKLSQDFNLNNEIISFQKKNYQKNNVKFQIKIFSSTQSTKGQHYNTYSKEYGNWITAKR